MNTTTQADRWGMVKAAALFVVIMVLIACVEPITDAALSVFGW